MESVTLIFASMTAKDLDHLQTTSKSDWMPLFDVMSKFPYRPKINVQVNVAFRCFDCSNTAISELSVKNHLMGILESSFNVGIDFYWLEFY